LRFQSFPCSVCVAVLLASCGSGSGGSTNPSFNFSLTSSIVLAPQDGTPASTNASISGVSSATLSVAGLPNGVTTEFTQPGSSGQGVVTLTASPEAPAGTYSVEVIASSGGTIVSQPLTLVVAVAVVVGSSTDTTLGINGKLNEFMSTSFGPSQWDATYFQDHAASEPAQYTFLAPQHTRIQVLSGGGSPWVANAGAASDWNFTILDETVQPVLGTTDHSPEFQIAGTPSFFKLPSPLSANDPNLQLFVSYAQNLVRYYNTGGFTWGGTLFKSPSNNHITWWGIHNEFNISGLTPPDYVVLYNAVVPAMLAVDPTIKISALELADFDYETGDPRNNLPTFVAPASQGGVNAQVNVASTHFYSSCDQTDSDTYVFSTIPSFVSDVQYFRQEFATRPDLGDVAVWVTENNVNADYDSGNGYSACNPSQKFVTDQRGTSAFFAAWRPYVFSQLGKAGNQGLYQWDYPADAQFGEVDYNTSNKYLSYWVDYSLGQFFPVTATTAPDILELTTTETATVETLATENPDGSYIVMVSNHAVQSPTDDNGPGAPRTIEIDVSALGSYTTLTKTTLQNGTDTVNGPQPVALSPAPKLSVTLSGYGTQFLHLVP
jgi:hypothetical protein